MSKQRFKFDQPSTEENYEDVDPGEVIVRVVIGKEEAHDWSIRWNKAFLEHAKKDEQAMAVAYRIAESVRESLGRMLGVQ